MVGGDGDGIVTGDAERMLYLVTLPRGLVSAIYAVLWSDEHTIPNCEHGLGSGMVGFEFDCLWREGGSPWRKYPRVEKIGGMEVDWICPCISNHIVCVGWCPEHGMDGRLDSLTCGCCCCCCCCC